MVKLFSLILFSIKIFIKVRINKGVRIEITRDNFSILTIQEEIVYIINNY